MSSRSQDSDAAAPNTSSARKSRFPELPPKYSSSRELRNKAEKMRRDRLNGLIEEMRALVPMICNKTKKSETTRSAILRLTANYLRVSRLFTQDSKAGEISGTSLVSEGLPHLESMDGFFFILSEDGRLLFVSENIDKFIGYSQIEMMGFPIFNFTHPADQSKIRKVLVSSFQPSLSEDTPAVCEGSGSASPERGPRQSFYIRLREKPLAKQDPPQYEHMHVVGHLRRQVDTVEHNTFIGVMRPVRDRPITELSLVESSQDQYITRHTPDGRIVYTDHRISTIAGYLPSEVRGKSAFNFFFAEDLPWTTMAMRHMFASSNGEGSTVYRLFTQTGELICLETRGFLEFNKTTNKIESFLCINTLIRPEDSERYLNEQKERFTPFISQLNLNNMVPGKQSEATSSSLSSLVSFSMLPSPVSVISKPTTNDSTSPPSMTSPRSRNSLKRSFAEVSNSQKEEDTIKERLESKILKSEKNLKRKQDDDDEGEKQQQRKRGNWQYTVRTEPVHRTEDGMRVMEIEEQFSHPDHAEQGVYKDQEGKMELQLLMNEMNKSLPGSSYTLNQNTGSNFPTDEELSQTKSQLTSVGVAGAGPRRVCSVIKMLPHRQEHVQKNCLETDQARVQPNTNNLPTIMDHLESPTNPIGSTTNHQPIFSNHLENPRNHLQNPSINQQNPSNHMQSPSNHLQNTTNPLDNDGSLADLLPQPSFNHSLNNSITRESDLIKQELINSSCSEAERIAEKLKAMLAPLSEQQNRSNSQEVSSLNLGKHPDQNQGGPAHTDLLEVLNQELIFPLDGATSEEKQLSIFKDEIPATSS